MDPKIDQLPPSAQKPQQKQNPRRIRRRCGCLMTDSAALSTIIIIIIIMITISAGSHEHLHSPSIRDGALGGRAYLWRRGAGWKKTVDG